jgi:hypothetical protein
MKEFFFIIGRGRSGTTLLSKLLNENKQVHIPPESFFILSLLKKYKKKSLKKTEIINFVNYLFKEKSFSFVWNIDKKELIQSLTRSKLKLNQQNIIKIIFSLHAESFSKKPKIFGHKAPIYSIYLSDLIKRFPSSKFIHIIRDPISNISSFKNMPFDFDNVGCLAQRWRIYNFNIEREKIKRPKSFLTIRFEDLINYQDKSLKKISSFLNIRHNNFYAGNSDVNLANFYWHKNLTKKTDKKVLSKKNNLLNAKEIHLIKNICHEELNFYNYDTLKKENKTFYLYFKYLSSAFAAHLYTFLEKLLFRLPLIIQYFVIFLYQKKVLKKYWKTMK